MTKPHNNFEIVPLRRHIKKTTNGTTATQIEEDETTVRVTRIETISTGAVNLEKVGFVDGAENLRQFTLRDGDILLSHINSMSVIGNSALVKKDVLPLYVGMNLLRLTSSASAFSAFLAWCLKSDFVRHQIRQFAKPAINQASISTTNLKRVRAPLPDLPTQKRIAGFLDRETARIDELIAKKEQLLHNFGPRLEALVATALTDESLPRVRFEHVSETMSRPCNLSDHDELVRLGLYNRGRGIFKKPAADEEGMGDSSFYFIEDGDLILSGQFAWEGAVAMASQSESGCVVSHRYPVYRGKTVKTSYLLAFFRSSYGDFVLNDASRGSAGRNRPLNTRRLSKEKIPIPSVHLQEQIEHTISAESRLRAVHFSSIERLRELRAALITAAVTGQIDVDNYGKTGATSATLDKIEEEMQA